MPKINLRQLVLLLTCGSVLLTLLVALWSGRQMHRDLLLEKALEANRLYATKIAKSANVYLRMAQQRLAYASNELEQSWDDPIEIDSIIARLREDSATFDTVGVISSDGTVLYAESSARGLLGKQIDTLGSRQALAARKPMISRPFVGATGQLMVSFTHPLEDLEGRYLGYVSGSLHLRREGLLNTLMGEHDFQDGSYLYVVDDEGRLIYHQDRARVGELVVGNPAVAAVRQQQSGAMRVTNSRGVDMLAGYAPVDAASWGVVANQPVSSILAELSGLVLRNLWYTLPGLLVSLALIWVLSAQISKPLSQIAQRARSMEDPAAREALLRVRSWYYEAAQIKASLLRGLSSVQGRIRRLYEASHTDQLTGLINRRGMEEAIAQWQASGTGYGLAVFDLDHFKAVNDRYGHDVGDLVLQEIAVVMGRQLRSEDVACRFGGEEFALLLPGMSLEETVEVAERVRRAVAETAMPHVGRVTVSCGAAHMPDTAPDFARVMKAADVALYHAKDAGRNRTQVAEPLAREATEDESSTAPA